MRWSFNVREPRSWPVFVETRVTTGCNDVSYSSSFTDDVAAGPEEPLLLHQQGKHAGDFGQTLRKHRFKCLLLLAGVLVGTLAAAVSISLVVHHSNDPYRLGGESDRPASRLPDVSSLDESSLEDQGWELFDAAEAEPYELRNGSVRSLESQEAISQDCADLWISQGLLCESVTRRRLAESTVEAVWTWVAENDYWTAWKHRMQHPQKAYTATGGSKMYRSHHQLKYSMRSVLAAMPHIAKLRLLTADLPACTATDETCPFSANSRVGQVPIWLDRAASRGSVAIQHHWQLFRTAAPGAMIWRNTTLPVFNSLAIESQLNNVAASAENILYLNDDSYITEARQVQPHCVD